MMAEWEVDGVYLASLLKVRHPAVFERLHGVLTSHGVEVRFLDRVRDIWAKDYCPLQVAVGEFVKFRYDPDYLRDDRGLRTGASVVNWFRGLGRCRRSRVVLDGGNVVASRRKAIVTEKIYKENPDWERAE